MDVKKDRTDAVDLKDDEDSAQEKFDEVKKIYDHVTKNNKIIEYYSMCVEEIMLGSCPPEEREKWETNLTELVEILGDALQPALDACKNAWTGELNHLSNA